MRRARLTILAIPVLVLLAGAAWTRLLVARAERAFLPEGRFVAADDATLRVVERGAGPPIVLLHGAFGGLEDWIATGILDDLARDHRVIAFDRPGHGWSTEPAIRAATPIAQARVLRAALREMRVEHPIVVGFSWGGACALAWAIEAPDELAGVALVNTVAYPWPGATATPYVLAGLPLVGPLLAHTVAAPYGAWTSTASVERAFDPAAVPESFARSPVPLALRPSTFLVEARDMRLLKPAVALQSTRYAEIRLPLAILAARGDRVAFWDFHSERLARTVPAAEFRLLEEGGHQLLHSHPDEVVAWVRRLAKRVAGGSAQAEPVPPR